MGFCQGDDRGSKDQREKWYKRREGKGNNKKKAAKRKHSRAAESAEDSIWMNTALQSDVQTSSAVDSISSTPVNMHSSIMNNLLKGSFQLRVKSTENRSGNVFWQNLKKCHLHLSLNDSIIKS